MYLCYLDESGTPELNGTSHFVLVGLAIVATDWKSFESQIHAVVSPFGLADEEIHTAWMARRYVEQEQIPNFTTLSPDDRRKETQLRRDQHLLRLAAIGTKKQLKAAKTNYRHTFAYLHLTFDERREVLRQLADTIGTWTEARLFAQSVDKSYLKGLPTISQPPFEYAFTGVVQRFEYFLRHRGNAVDRELNGLLVQDNNQTVAKKLTSMMRQFHRQGTRWTSIDHILETPFFVDSQLTSMVQMADLCGYATRRFFENGETDLFDRIYNRFDRTSHGVVGLRHYTAPGCTCRVCQDHA